MNSKELNKPKLVIDITKAGNSLTPAMEEFIKKEAEATIILIGEEALPSTIATIEHIKTITSAEIIVIDNIANLRKKNTMKKIGIVGAGGAYEQEMIKVLDQMHERDLEALNKPFKITNHYAEPRRWRIPQIKRGTDYRTLNAQASRTSHLGHFFG